MDARRRAELERRAMERLEAIARDPRVHARLVEATRSKNPRTAEQAAKELARLEAAGYIPRVG